MKLYDITRTLQEAPVYPGDEPPAVEPVEKYACVRLSRIGLSSHAGTHADALSHFLPEGLTIDEMPLERYCGPCAVLSVPGDGLIRADELRGRIMGHERIVLHTGGARFLCEEAAEYLVSCGVRTLVTDAVSVGPEDNEMGIHNRLLGAGVAVVENTVLDQVQDGAYLLFAFPMKIGGCDGAPVRAVLISEETD